MAMFCAIQHVTPDQYRGLSGDEVDAIIWAHNEIARQRAKK